MKHKNIIALVFMSIMLILCTSSFADDYYREWVKTQDLTVKNVPVFEAGLGIETSGNVWYVDSGASGTAAGTSWTNACLTVDAAINLATASNGDVIRVAAGHAESFSAADGFDLDKAGITIIHHGSRDGQATYTFADTDATIAVGAAGCRVFGGRYLAGISGVVIGWAIEAGGDNFQLIDAYFPEPTTSTFEFLDAIDLAALADGVQIIRPVFFNADATGGAHFVEMGNGVNKNFQLIDPYIVGEFSVAAVWSNDADEEVLISGGSITNMTNGQHAIEFSSTATGIIDNVLVRTDAQATAVDPGSLNMSNVLWVSDTATDSTSTPVVLGSAGAASIGTVNSTTTDSIHGKIGTDTEMGDSSLYDLIPNSANSASWNATALTAIEGEAQDALQAEQVDHIAGVDTTVVADGDLTTYIADGSALSHIMTAGADTSDYQASDDSLEAIRDRIDDINTADQIDIDAILADTITISGGTLPATPTSGSLATYISGGSTALGQPLPASMSLVDIIGNYTGAYNGAAADDNIKAALDIIDANIDDIETDTSAMQPVQEMAVETSAAVMVNDDTIFTIAGGPIEILNLVSICVTLNDATASTLQYSADPTVGAAVTISGASATLANFAAGGAVIINMTALDTAPDLSVVAAALGPVQTRRIVVNEGIIKLVIGVGSTTGTWKHYLRYRPLGTAVTVTGS